MSLWFSTLVKKWFHGYVLTTETAGKFFESLYFDDSGRLSCKSDIENKASCEISFDYHPKSTWGKSKGLITELQDELSKLKETVEQNMIWFLQEQNPETSWS